MAATEAVNNTELKAIAERLSRRLDEIKAMDSASLNALGKVEEINEETAQALTFQDDIYYWILKIQEFVTNEYHPVSTFQNKPTPKVHINLPKLHIQPFNGIPRPPTVTTLASTTTHTNTLMQTALVTASGPTKTHPY